MNKQVTKRLLCLMLALTLCLGLVMPAGAVSSGSMGNGQVRVRVERVENDAVSAVLPDAREKAADTADAPLYADTDVVRVSIVLEERSTVQTVMEKGGSLTEIASDSQALAYRAALRTRQDAVTSAISRQVLGGEKLDVVWNLTLAANIISANVPYGKLDGIRQVAGVKDVVLEAQYEPMVVAKEEAADPMMATSAAQIGSSAAYSMGYTGAGTRIAVIDTGTDYQHQSFNAAAFEYALAQKGLDMASLNLLDKEELTRVIPQLNIVTQGRTPDVTADQLYLTSKLPFAYNYVDKDFQIDHSEFGGNIHGSHVAGIAAANSYIPKDGGFVPALTEVKTQGVAPEAQLLTMKVFGKKGGAFESDYMVAIEDALILGCDSVNLSIGSVAAGFSRSETYQYILDELTSYSSVVSIAAGNNGNWGDYTYSRHLYMDGVNLTALGQPGAFTNSLAVASADNTGYTGMYFTVNGAVHPYTERLYGQNSMATLAGEREYIFFTNAAVENSQNLLLEYKNVIQGKIVFCYRGGGSSFPAKANAVVAAGGIATVVCNNESGAFGMNMTGYTNKQPAVSVSFEDGEAVRKASTPVKNTKTGEILYYTGKMVVGEGFSTVTVSEQSQMSDFSSWGVPGSLILKPEITAPGGSIFSVDGDYYTDHTQYLTMSGTSMAAPQVAGMAALMAQYIRDKGLEDETGLTTRALSQSLLMSTAVPMKDGEAYYPLLQQGAGLANVGAAVMADSYILMDESATASWADGKVKVELGDDPARTGKYSFGFTLYNLTEEAKGYDLSSDLFTQAILTANGKEYLSTATASLDHTAVWTVDGKVVDPDDLDLPDLSKYDFDGSGYTDKLDAQYLMDAIVKGESVKNGDVSGDGSLTTYDVTCLLDKLNAPTGAVVLPAGGKAHVEVTLTLTDEQKEALNDKYPVGAYIQGFVFVTGHTDLEGKLGTAHSVPVLGFYGNWSDSTMFEVATRQAPDFQKRWPYIYQGFFPNWDTNYLTVVDASGESFTFGGNPLLKDSVYSPERNAISGANGDKLHKWYFTAIRNGYVAKVAFRDGEKEFWSKVDEGYYAAFYNYGSKAWQNIQDEVTLDYDFSKVANNTEVTFAMTLVPEYYVDMDGNVAWEKLGKGATYEFPFVVDNEAPKVDVNSVVYDAYSNSITLDASDNQYIAAVALFNSSGTENLAAAGSDPEAQPGVPSTYVLELDEGVQGSKFLVQVYDYATNFETYQLTVEVGGKVEMPDRIAYDTRARTWVGFGRNASTYNQVTNFAKATTPFSAATLVNGYVVAVNDNNEVCVMPQDNLADVRVIGKAPEGGVRAMASNPSGKVYALSDDGKTLYDLDKLTARFTTLATLEGANTLACDDKGSLYCTGLSSDAAKSRTVYTLTEEGVMTELVSVSADMLNGFDVNMNEKQGMAYDFETGKLVWTSYGNSIGGKKGFLIEVDLATKTAEVKGNLGFRFTSLMVPGPITGEDWTLPTDKVDSVTIEPAEKLMIRGGTTKLEAVVKPWNISDSGVIWESLNPDIVTVAPNGMVTAVAKGEATVRATSKLDSTKSGTCQITVDVLGVELKGATRKDGQSQMFTWNMEREETWTGTTKFSTPIESITMDTINNHLLVMDANTYKIDAIDPNTGKVVKTYAAPGYPNEEDNKYIDLEYSQAFSTANDPFVFGIYAYSLFAWPTSQLHESGRLGFQVSSQQLVAIASMGKVQSSTADGTLVTNEMVVALDAKGNMTTYSITWDSENQQPKLYTYPESTYSVTLPEEFPGEGDSYRSSMIYSPEDNSFYLAAFNGTTSNLYQITRYAGGLGKAEPLGSMGPGVYPTALYGVEFPKELGGNAVNMETLGEPVEVPLTAMVPETAAPSASPVMPLSDADLTTDDSMVTVDLTALNQMGLAAESRNGKLTLTYNAAQFAVDSVKSDALIFSYDDSKTGTLVVGYAGLTPFAAKDTVATVTLKRLTTEKTDKLAISHQELDDQTLSHTEKLVTMPVVFEDVEEGKYFYTPVYWAAARGIATGRTATKFFPYDTCKRGEIVTFLWRAAGEPEPQTTVCPFTDVSSERFYYKAVLWAYENGITTGITATTFEPERTVNRGQIVTFLWRMAGEPQPASMESPFTDVQDPNRFYYTAVLWAVENGITTGASITQKIFTPYGDGFRRDVVTFLYRYYN